MKKVLVFSLISTFALSANAFEYSGENYKVAFTGNLNGGGLGYKTESLDVSGRGLYDAFFQLNSEWKPSQFFTLGAMISERLTSTRAYTSNNQYGLRDAFVYIQNNRVGRIEVGRTDPIAMKLHVFVPDVSGLRIHSKSFIYKYMLYDEYADTTTADTSSYRMNRISVVSAGRRQFQFGFSFAPGDKINDFDNRKINSAWDFGIRYRNNDFKFKPAVSFGTVYIDNPVGRFGDTYSAAIDADYRLEFSSGFNLSYNSFVFGLSGKYVYDKGNLLGAEENYVLGSGLSYDLLAWSFSLGYYFSENSNEDVRTLAVSSRYKFNESMDCWFSVGSVSADKNSGFVASGLRFKF